MKRKCTLLAVLISGLLILAACSEKESKVEVVKKDKNKASATVTSEQKDREENEGNEGIEGIEDSEMALDVWSVLGLEPKENGNSKPTPTTKPAAKPTTKAEPRQWNGEAPSLNEKWTGFYYGSRMSDGGIFVLILDHDFSKKTGNGYFEAQYQYVYIEDDGSEYISNYSQNEWGSFSEEGGVGFFQDYGPDPNGGMPSVTKAMLYFHGDSVEFGFDYNDGSEIVLETLRLKDLSYR